MDIEIKLLLKETAYNMVSELLLLNKKKKIHATLHLFIPRQLSSNLVT